MERILEMLDEKVNEIFLDEQERRGIKYGDADPLATFELDRKKEDLAKVIEYILNGQEG